MIYFFKNKRNLNICKLGASVTKMFEELGNETKDNIKNIISLI